LLAGWPLYIAIYKVDIAAEPLIKPSLLLVPMLGLLACSGRTTSPGEPEACTGYPSWSTSPFMLPYPAGASYNVIQANCSLPGNGHRGANRYAYDFGMTIGTPIAASRAGTVVDVEESHTDGQIGPTGLDNFVVILHADGSTALYGHLTHNGVAPALGDAVAQGQIIASSGNTGNTAGIPHLHLSIQDCDPVTLGTTICPSRPLTFSNTDANANGLMLGQSYTAR
jgi:murein DD-endopeptidase MepM/ murein hydrolase activator NlpD